MNPYDIEKGRQAARDFRKAYYEAHACCPSCRGDNYSSTYVGYIPVIKEDYTVGEYKDENRIRCRCGWQGLRHDLVGRI
jgi:hypothetical protein